MGRKKFTQCYVAFITFETSLICFQNVGRHWSPGAKKKNGMKLMESKKMEKRKNTLDQKVIFEKIIFVP